MANFFIMVSVLLFTSLLRAEEVLPSIIPLEKKLTSEEFGQLLIPVKADSVKMNLLLDTGSKLTVLNKSMLGKTYKPNGFAFNTSMHGKRHRLRTIFLDQLTIGDHKIIKPRVALSELSDIGLLGMDALRGTCFELQTKTPSLSLKSSCTIKAGDKFEYFNKDLIVLKVHLNNKVYSMIYDTGASITVIDAELPWQDFAEKIKSKTVRIVDSARHKDSKEVYKAKSITVSGKSIPGVRFIRSNLNDFQKKSKLRVHGIIGFNLIMSGDWNFDLNSKEFSLTLH